MTNEKFDVLEAFANGDAETVWNLLVENADVDESQFDDDFDPLEVPADDMDEELWQTILKDAELDEDEKDELCVDYEEDEEAETETEDEPANPEYSRDYWKAQITALTDAARRIGYYDEKFGTYSAGAFRNRIDRAQCWLGWVDCEAQSDKDLGVKNLRQETKEARYYLDQRL